MTDFAALQAKMRDVLGRPGFLSGLQPAPEPSSLSTNCSSKWESRSARRRTYLSHWALIIIPILFLAVLAFYFLLMDVGATTAIIEERNNISNPLWRENTQETFVIQEEVLAPVAFENVIKTTIDTAIPSTLQTILQTEKTSATVPQKSTESTPTEPATAVPQTTVGPTTKAPAVEVSITKAETAEIHVLPNVKLNKTNSTVILLKKDNNGTEFFIEGKRYQHPREYLKIVNAPDLRNRTRDGVVFDDPPSKPLTTPRGFQYTPTVPLLSRLGSIGGDTTTSSYNETDDLHCFSPRIPFCEGILPYDMVQLPRIPDVHSPRDLDTMLPYFQLIVQSGCSARAREFICAVLEPECTPSHVRLPTPCKVNCKVLSEDCKDFILETLPLSRIFDCRRYPDYDENSNCINVARGQCFHNEFQCPDGSCIPRKWVCDGVHDCPGSKPALDEQNCPGCSSHEFRCIMDGHCIPTHWKCDGMADCNDNSDESSC